MRALLGAGAITAGALVGAGAAIAAPGHPEFGPIGSYRADIPLGEDQTAAETFAISGGRMYVTNAVNRTLDVVDVTDPTAPVRLDRIALLAAPNSVDAAGDLVAVALDADPKTDPGSVRFFRRSGDSLAFIADVTVGAVPDMVTFTRGATALLVANEGEPSGYGGLGVDPEGSVSIIDTRGILDGATPTVRTADFAAFNAGAGRHHELPAGIRLNGPGASVAQDLEPEYVSISRDGRTAFVSLQENNAIAQIDIRRARVSRIVSMGLRDHNAAGHAIDAGDQDSAINIAAWPVTGIPMPDGIAAFRVKGRDYVITANEGDAREWAGFADVGRLRGSSGADANVQVPGYSGSLLRNNANLGRLNISLTDGWDGAVLRRPHSLGSRSVSILRPDGALVWDSGDAFERTIAAQRPSAFNVSNSNNTFDNRSDDKGPEPEGVAVGKITGRTYAFVALERAGGMIVLDISNPSRGRVVQWANSRDYAAAPTATDSGPEIVRFLGPAKSPTGAPLVVLSNEVSGSVVFYAPLG
jgi:hypothetical protein